MNELNRRDFLAKSSSCAAHIALASIAMPAAARAAWANAPLGRVVAREAFGSLERVSDGIWALISTPLTGDRTTLSNGGIIAGRNGVLAIEGFNTPAGATWLATQARDLTGRWPTHVALTHYHSDHANGVAGYERADAKPVMHATEATRSQVLERNLPADAARTDALKDVTYFSGSEPTVVDLGGVTVRVVPRSGHTSSDVSLELDDRGVLFCGDLFWNAMFPNYVDAIPSQLSKSARALRRQKATTYVAGHGALAKEAELDRYFAMIDEIESTAKRGHENGQTAAELGANYALPASLGEWVLFNKVFFERAFAAWYRELDRHS